MDDDLLEGLPGAEWIAVGVRDLQRERDSVEALCVSAASNRLRELGLTIPEHRDRIPEPELALYRRLQAEVDDPYYRYNALRRELDSFMDALGGRLRRQRRAS